MRRHTNIDQVSLRFRVLQEMTLGTFVTHRSVTHGAIHEAKVPLFTYFAGEQTDSDSRAELLASSDGQILIRADIGGTSVIATGPHNSLALDPPAPDGYYVLTVRVAEGNVARRGQEPFACENGACDDPDDPLDECNDGIDNDGDGHADLCDWNCLPHADYRADAFPEARSRVESGETYALMGHGSLCTQYPDTWEIELADSALRAAELLDSLRPDLGRPIRFRTFSCWVFDNWEAYNECQFGPYQIVDGEPVYGAPICSPGMEDYPYGPTEADQLSAFDQANLFFEEALPRVWADFELSAAALGASGEPVNGVVLLTSDLRTACKMSEFPQCPPVAGIATLPHGDPQHRGTAIVTDQPYIETMWTTLAHEIGHTIGLVHDDYPQGFMNQFSGDAAGLGLSVDDEYPNLDNATRWEFGLTGSKGKDPRSPGFYLSGCEGPAECAPLGKPGWSCAANVFCEEN
ncbi:zinc-dependent metalloprotease family protein [Enhygromyxa salina]|uniref:zinc-dependent metalloprotease family protein n=1 Tax=Enhygromyxa salina TaxID=215803 RepID=UPI0013FD0889|nr:zinc-dependent metalloprotease family protein [Enhygromyxa salina]